MDPTLAETSEGEAQTITEVLRKQSRIGLNTNLHFSQASNIMTQLLQRLNKNPNQISKMRMWVVIYVPYTDAAKISMLKIGENSNLEALKWL